MKRITLQHTDLDSVTGETWVEHEQAYLLTPHIILYSHHTGFGFHCFEEAITDEQSPVSTNGTHMIDFTISGANVESIDLAELANMTMAELADILATQIH